MSKKLLLMCAVIIVLSVLVFSELFSKQPAYDDLKDTNPDAAASLLLSAAAFDPNKVEYLLFKKELSKQYEILLSEKYLKLKLSVELFKIDRSCEPFKLIEENNIKYLQTASAKNSISELEILSQNNNIKGFGIDKNGKLTMINKIDSAQAMEIPENFGSMYSSDDGKTFFFEAAQGKSLRVNLKSLGMSTLAGGDYIDAQGYSISRTGNKEVITLTNPSSDFKTNYNGQEVQVKPFANSNIALIRDSAMKIETQNSAISCNGMDADIQSGEFRIDPQGRTAVKGLAKVATYSGGDLIFLDKNSRLNAELTSAESEFTAKSQDSNAEFSFSGEGNLHVLGNSLSSLSSEAEVKGTYYGKGSEQGDLAFDMKDMKLKLFEDKYYVEENDGFFAVATSQEKFDQFDGELDDKEKGFAIYKEEYASKNIVLTNKEGKPIATSGKGKLKVTLDEPTVGPDTRAIIPPPIGIDHYFMLNNGEGRNAAEVYISARQLERLGNARIGEEVEIGGVGSGFVYRQIDANSFRIYSLHQQPGIDLTERGGILYNGNRGYQEVLERLRPER